MSAISLFNKLRAEIGNRRRWHVLPTNRKLPKMKKKKQCKRNVTCNENKKTKLNKELKRLLLACWLAVTHSLYAFVFTFEIFH